MNSIKLPLTNATLSRSVYTARACKVYIYPIMNSWPHSGCLYTSVSKWGIEVRGIKCHDTGKPVSKCSRAKVENALRATSGFLPRLFGGNLFRLPGDEIMHHARCEQSDAAYNSAVVDKPVEMLNAGSRAEKPTVNYDDVTMTRGTYYRMDPNRKSLHEHSLLPSYT